LVPALALALVLVPDLVPVLVPDLVSVLVPDLVSVLVPDLAVASQQLGPRVGSNSQALRQIC